MIHPLRSTCQQKAKSKKTALLADYTRTKALIASANNSAFFAPLPQDECTAIFIMSLHYKDMMRKDLMRECKNAAISLEDQIAQLKSATLESKREILHCMPIITVPVSAAFLGMPEAALYGHERGAHRPFGDDYMGASCYSMEELFMMMQNPELMCEKYAMSLFQEDKLPTPTALDHAISVDDEVAMAFTNLSYSQLTEQVHQGGHSRRPYRLADLEKIRVAKLAATKH